MSLSQPVGCFANRNAAHARYPIFWGLDSIGQLPNPDPSDTAEVEKKSKRDTAIVVVDEEFENARPELKRQAQQWANLEQDPEAELFVFVGRCKSTCLGLS